MSTALHMTRGQTSQWNIPVTLAGVADPIPGGAVITWTAADRGTIEITKTSADGIVIVDAQAGTAQLQLDPDDTLGLTDEHDTVLAWDCWLTFGVSEYPLASGSLTVHVGPRLWDAE